MRKKYRFEGKRKEIFGAVTKMQTNDNPYSIETEHIFSAKVKINTKIFKVLTAIPKIFPSLLSIFSHIEE